jgi:arsenite methyltransferase
MDQTDYLSRRFDWTDPEFIDSVDQVSLWSAMAGSLLLEHVPLRRNIRALDVGCGTGFPLLELAQQLGPGSVVVGIDPWPQALERARRKMELWQISNVEIVQGDAAAMPWTQPQFDLIVSNLGVNNFADPAKALAECHRVAKPGGVIALSTNLRGHMREFYDVFEQTLRQCKLDSLLSSLAKHIDHRTTVEQTSGYLRDAGFTPTRSFMSSFAMRFADGSAFFRHGLIMSGFLDAWRKVVESADQRAFFAQLEANLNHLAKTSGELSLTIPLAYIEAVKPA